MRDSVRRRLVEVAAPIGASAVVLVFVSIRGAIDSMWLDEAFSFSTAQRPLGSMIDFILTKEPNMGPYYMALWAWIRVDDGDLWIRSLSALWTVVALWGVWAIVRRLSGAGLAGLAAVLFVLTPFVLSWSMQARGYTMAMAATAWSLVFADRIRMGEDWWSAVLFGVMAGLGVATHFATVFVFIGIVIALMALTPMRAVARSLAVSGAAAAVTFAPFAVAAVRKPDHASWVPVLTIDWFLEAVDGTVSGPVWALLMTTGVASLVIASIRTVRLRPYLMPVAGIATGFLGLVAYSMLVRPMFVDRYLIGCIPLIVVAACGGWSIVWPKWRAAVIASAVGIALLNLATSIDRTRPALEDYRSAAAVVASDRRSDDGIVAMLNYPNLGMIRYLPPGTSTHRLVPARDRPGEWIVRTVNGREVHPQRLWVLTRDARSTPELDAWMDRTYPSVESEETYGNLVLQLRSRG